MVRTSQRVFVGLSVHSSFNACNILAGEATGEPGFLQSLPKPQPSGISTLLMGRSTTSSLRKMTLRWRLSAPELPVKFRMHDCRLGQSREGSGRSATFGVAFACALSQQGKPSPSLPTSSHFPSAAIAVYSYAMNDVKVHAEVRS